MKPSEQTNLIRLLQSILPPEYYAIGNDDYVEIHKYPQPEIDEEKEPPQFKFHF